MGGRRQQINRARPNQRRFGAAWLPLLDHAPQVALEIESELRQAGVDQIADILAEEVPNAETVAAARRGEGTDFATLDEMFADLNAPDH